MPPLQQIRTPDKTRIAFRVYGPPHPPSGEPRPASMPPSSMPPSSMPPSSMPPSSIPIVLCDGISCDGYIWRDLLPALVDAGHPVLHFHYRGHGRSGLPPRPDKTTIADLAGDLSFLLDHLGWPEATLIGHSMGVQVALEAAIRYPERVRALALCCGSDGRLLDTLKRTDLAAKILPTLEHVTHTWREAVSVAVRAIMPSPLAYTFAALTEIKGELIRQSDFQPYLDHFARMPLDLFTSLLADAAGRTAQPSLHRVTQPSLVIAGEDDGLTPVETSESLARALPNADFTVIPGTSHTAPIEAPAVFLRSVFQFLDTLVQASHDKPTSAGETSGPEATPPLWPASTW